MAATNAHYNRPKAVYGKQIERGNKGEARAAGILRKSGYSVSFSKTHPRGKSDLTAKKGKTIRRIQVKTISSRNLKTAKAARRRISNAAFKLKRIPKDTEVWVFDKENRLYRFSK